jgi:hypothetical protein
MIRNLQIECHSEGLEGLPALRKKIAQSLSAAETLECQRGLTDKE